MNYLVDENAIFAMAGAIRNNLKIDNLMRPSEIPNYLRQLSKVDNGIPVIWLNDKRNTISCISNCDIESLGPGAFLGCKNLQEINLSKVTYIHPNAFFYNDDDDEYYFNNNDNYYSSSYSSNINDNNDYYSSSYSDNYSFDENDFFQISLLNYSDNDYLYYASSSSSHVENLNLNCINLQNIAFPKLLSLENNTFKNAFNLSVAYLPECKTIKENAFLNCHCLNKIIVNNCSYIGSSAFKNCSSFFDLYLGDYIADFYLGQDAFLNTGLLNFNLYVPESQVSFYYEDPQWNIYNIKTYQKEEES